MDFFHILFFHLFLEFLKAKKKIKKIITTKNMAIKVTVKRLFSRFGEIEVIDSVGMDDAG